MITVVLADDHPVVRQGLRAVFEATEGVDVVGEEVDGAEAARVCVETRPDVVLLDLQMPRLNGIEAMREIRRSAPETAVLVLTMYDDDDILAAVAAGAAGYLLKGSDGHGHRRGRSCRGRGSVRLRARWPSACSAGSRDRQP